MRLMLAALALGAGVASASATEWMNCADSAGSATIGLLLGQTDVLSVAAITLTAGDKVWASDVAYGPGDPVSLGQAFEDAETIRVDAMDKDFALLAQLRLFKAQDAEELPVFAGTLSIRGIGAWPVSCSGP